MPGAVPGAGGRVASSTTRQGPSIKDLTDQRAEDSGPQNLWQTNHFPLQQENVEQWLNEELVISSSNWTNRVFYHEKTWHQYTRVNLNATRRKVLCRCSFLRCSPLLPLPQYTLSKQEGQQHVLSGAEVGLGRRPAWVSLPSADSCSASGMALLKPWCTHAACVAKVQNEGGAHPCGKRGVRPMWDLGWQGNEGKKIIFLK